MAARQSYLEQSTSSRWCSTLARAYDIAIVGAGILGLSCAYHLKKNNPAKDILVLDRFGDIAQGNTARSNAMFRNTFTSADNLTLSDSSIDFYLDTQRSGKDLGLKKTGYLWVMSERQLSSNEKHIRKMQEKGIETKLFDKPELEKAIPSMRTEFRDDEESELIGLEDIAGALFGIKCGRLDPQKLSRFYADEFAKLGGKISFNTNVKRLLVMPDHPLGIDGEPFVWQESKVGGAVVDGELQGAVEAETTVIAAGVWNNQILEPLGIDGRVKGKKRQLFVIQASGNAALSNFIYNKSFNLEGVLPFLILPKSGCYLKALEESREFWIGCEDDFNRPYINIPEDDLENYRAEPSYYEKDVHPILKGYLPQFGDERPSRMWAGLYSYNTLDSIPFVFPENGLIVAGGGSGSGIMKADSMGRIVDAAYREGEGGQATLYGGAPYDVRKIGFRSRQVEREEWVI